MEYHPVAPLAIQPIIEFKVDQHVHAKPITIQTQTKQIQLVFHAHPYKPIAPLAQIQGLLHAACASQGRIGQAHLA